MNTKEILIAARALIADPSCWTQNDYAVDELGEDVDEMSPTACRFCAVGAVLRVTGEYADEDEDVASVPVNRLHNAAQNLYGASAVETNDNPRLGHAAVLKVYDQAISDCED